MISSAVVIPEEQAPVSSSSPNSLKRRQSSFTTDSNKRPRIEIDGLENGTKADEDPASRPKPSSAIEEKKRSKRLFGALLGTLSQTSSRPAHKKRDEIEQRQRERLKKDNEEREQATRRKKEELDRTRRIEQKEWNTESTRLRHANMRATANFLKTKTEPHLYYKPWDLRSEEENQIKKQIVEVEDTIQRETSEYKVETDHERFSHATHPINGDALYESSEPKDETNDAKGKTVPVGEEPRTESIASPLQPEAEDPPETKIDQPKDDDHGGEELVEGREDDVMY